MTQPLGDGSVPRGLLVRESGGWVCIQLTLTCPRASWAFIKRIQTGKKKAHPISRSGPSTQEEDHSLHYPVKSGLCPYVG